MGHEILPEGRGVFLRVEAEDQAGLRVTWRSAAIVVDTSPPAVEGLSCTPAVSSSRSEVTCHWRGLRERESRVTSLAVCVATVDNACDVTPPTPLDLDVLSWHGDVSHLVQTDSLLSSVYVILQLTNTVGLRRNMSARILVDRTPPVPGTVSIITSDMTSGAKDPAQCQVSTEFLEVLVEGFKDEESNIATCDLALETTQGAADLRGFEPVTQGRVELVTGLRLPDPGQVTAVVRCSNMAGLFSTATSLPVAVSGSPLLHVMDGPGQHDIDFQSTLTSMSGRWLYSDPCPVVSAQWRLETLDGRDVIAFHDIPLHTTSFASDVMDLEPDVTYVNVIRTVDALNRTRETRSDGVAMRVEPPYPGEVRDGESRDLDFQLSDSSLTVQWDPFGLPDTADPTQRIVQYEVAIGDGLSYENGHSNVQPFTSVGLNLSVTFTSLTLTSKEVTYFATVRAYSEAGGVAEASSDGVKVGFDSNLYPGVLDLPAFSSSASSVTFAWSSFTSDLGIAEYKVALTDSTPNLPNGTFFLKDWPESALLTPQPLTSVGLDATATLQNLTLIHGNLYYAIVVGFDLTDRCLAISAGPVLVDLTPPHPGNVSVEGAVYSDAVFVSSSSELGLTLEGPHDPESGIASCRARLLAFHACAGGDVTTVADMEVTRDNRVSLSGLDLDSTRVHRLDVTCFNGAGQNATCRSLPVLVEPTPPLPGSVKVGRDWRHPAFLRNDTTAVQATVAVNSGASGHCQRERSLFPSAASQSTWSAQGAPFSARAVYLEADKLHVAVGYDDTLTSIEKGGMKSTEFSVVEGNYTFRFRAARAQNIITSYIFGLPNRQAERTFVYPPPEDASSTLLDDVTENSNSASRPPTFTPDFGFSLSVYGWSENGTWWCLASIRDDQQQKWQWTQLPFDPTASFHNYTFSLALDVDDMIPTWTVNVFMGDDVALLFRGLRLPDRMALYLEIVNNEDFAPAMDDPFKPPFTVAQISAVVLPVAPVPDCVYGAAFADPDVGVKEIWLGVSEEDNSTALPMTLVRSFCRPCPSSSCAVGCDPDCPQRSSWELLQLEVRGLTLHPGRGVNQSADSNVTTSLGGFKETTYRVTVRAVNFAGVGVEAESNRFVVDITPPSFKFLHCTDPAHSLDEPVEFVGSNSSIGAFWECDEDVSAIVRYTVAVGSTQGDHDIYPQTSFGTETKVALQLQDKPLLDNNSYYVTVTAENSAGLMSALTCKVTAELSVLNVTTSLESSMLYTSRDLPGLHTSLTSTQDRVGVVLPANDNPKALYYEWDVDTGGEGGRLFNTLTVGCQGGSQVEVRAGQLFLDGQRVNATLHQPQNVSSLGTQTDTTTTPLPHSSSFLRLEPGRCYYQTLKLVSRAHLSSSSQPSPICLKREKDTEVDLRDGSVTVRVSEQGDVISRRRRSTTTSVDVATVEFKGLDGVVVVGGLNSSDLEQDYGSSAAASYLPYISQDLSSSAPCSRLVTGRLVRYTGVSLFISPTPFALAEGRIGVEVLQPENGDPSRDTVLAPLVWHADRMLWMHWDELCPADLATDCVIGEPVQNLTASDATRVVPTTALYRPLHLAVFEIKRQPQNSPPVPSTLSFSVAEDSELQTRLMVTDPENDDVIFSMKSTGDHGVGSVDATGLLRYAPQHDFCGEDTLKVTITEVGVPASLTPNTVSYDVIGHVTCVNDAPTLQLVSRGQTLGSQNSEEVTLTWRGRLSLMPASFSLGHLVLADPDQNDILEIEYRSEEPQQVALQVADVTNSSHGVDLSQWRGQATRVFQLSMTRPSRPPQDLQLQAIARDARRFYSRSLQVTVRFRDVLCSSQGCGQLDISTTARDEAKKFVEYVFPGDGPVEVTIEDEDASLSSIRVNATAVRLYLSSPSHQLNTQVLTSRLHSLLARYLAVSPDSVQLTLEVSEPALTASGSVTEVLMSATLNGVPISAARLDNFVTSSNLDAELGVTVHRDIPPNFDQPSTTSYVAIAAGVSVSLAVVVVAVVVLVILYKKGKCKKDPAINRRPSTMYGVLPYRARVEDIRMSSTFPWERPMVLSVVLGQASLEGELGPARVLPSIEAPWSSECPSSDV